MNESSNEWTDPTPMRERELALEIARLKAELEAAKGVDAGEAASRFLTLAANTVDAALEDARREADELVTEVTADAEARRDEATRLAAEAEARAEAMRVEAENHESIVTAAHETAGQIRSNAEVEAASLVASERAKVVEEIESLSQVRAHLEGEREALESYHEQLRRRVQELAESMVNFMTTEPPIAAAGTLDELVAAEAESDTDAEPAFTVPDFAEHGTSGTVQYAPFEESAESIEQVESVEHAFGGVPIVEAAIEEPSLEDVPVEASILGEPLREEPLLEELSLEETFAGEPAFDLLDQVPPLPTVPTSGGLFSRATEEETAGEGSPLFSANGSRLVQQTKTEDLADALGYEDEADAAFESFLAGDSETDPSRDWLLRPEQT